MKKKNLIRLQDITFGTIAASSLFLLVGASGANATTSAVDEVTITVPASCSLTNTIGSPHTATIETGVYQDDIGETTFKVFCNDNEGFAVYAVGYTNDTFGNTTMKPSALADTNAIATGLATSGDTSNWAMKLTAVSGDYAPTLETGFNDYHVVPDTYTKVATYASNTDSSTGSSFKSTYGAFISQTQPADSYTGKVKYTVIHPANGTAPITPVANMQNMSSSVCTSTPAYVTDSRDKHIYTIQRLTDGNCWMMEDLDLGRTELTTDLTPTNTHLSTTITAETFNSWKKDSGTGSYNTSEYISVSGSDATSGTPYGTLYNYCAASAGTICGDSNSFNASSDICPTGWRLPTSNDFYTLYDKYNSNALMRASTENNGAAFALAGYFEYSAPTGQGSYGNYWSSSRNNATNMVALRLNASDLVQPAASIYRNRGHAIRCMLDEPLSISKLTYLQDFKNLPVNDKNSVLTSMEDNTIYSLIDNRDNKTYQIAKLKDGNIWMTENLDLGRTALTTNLTPSNTNLSTTIAASTFNDWKKTSTTSSFDSGEFISLSGSESITNNPYGTLYNYYAASAGTVSGASYSGNYLYDICPAGWQLPSLTKIQTLYSNYNAYANMTAAVENNGAGFVRSGEFIHTLDNSNPTLQGSRGFYWSSTGWNTENMYILFFYNSYVNPADNNSRRAGLAIRCTVK